MRATHLWIVAFGTLVLPATFVPGSAQPGTVLAVTDLVDDGADGSLIHASRLSTYLEQKLQALAGDHLQVVAGEQVRAAMRAQGINGTIYTHPIGDRGHGAGPLIGLWDHQEGVPGRGDVPLLPSTWFSIELQATTPVPEWGGQAVRSAQEEDAELGADGAMRWILRRQTAFHIVR